MKRMFGFLLAFIMFFCFFSIEAEAAQTITNVSVGGITPPAAGEKAIEMTTVGILYVDSTAPYKMLLQSCDWKDENGNIINNIDYKFESGRSYNVSMNFYAKEGWVFSNSGNITVEIKGVSSSKYSYKITYNDGEIITVKFTFNVAGSRTYPDIEKVEFWAITAPKEGNYPVNSVTHLYDNAVVTESYWAYHQAVVSSNTKFVANREYEFNIILDAKSGYKFSDDAEIWYYNGPVEHKKTFNSSKTRMIISIPYYVGDLNEITNVEITSFELPKAGNWAYPVDSDFICVPESDEYDIGGFSNSWRDSNGNKLTSTDKFVAGKKYTASVYFYAKNGYRFEDSSNITARIRGIDPSKYSVNIDDVDGSYCTMSFTFTAEYNPPETFITHVDVIGVQEPVAGEYVTGYGRVAAKSECRILDDGGKAAVFWYVNDTQETNTFKEYTSYTVKIWLEGHERYFAGSGKVTATINGYPAKIERNGAKQTMISYTFPATEGRTEYNVNFYKDSTMQQRTTIKAKGDYLLPQCMFTRPAGKNFGGWLVEGNLKQPGEWIKVYSDLDIIAVWEDIEEVPITVSEMNVTISGQKAGSITGATKVTINADCPYKNCYTPTIFAWYHSDNVLDCDDYMMGSADRFVAGETYIVEVNFNPTGKNIISQSVVAMINGYKGRVGGNLIGGGKMFRVAITIPGTSGGDSGSDSDILYGDVDLNGKVNVLDANLVRRYAAKQAELTAVQLVAADVDGNGKVNVLDANLIRRYAAKVINIFPVEE
ncbi:MAG: dockerin type I repeat-containing protein [Oscillospiraceae bacterium]|nr:dockerin type I repeat-containing protein [Oscillospiraceae bacterium]